MKAKFAGLAGLTAIFHFTQEHTQTTYRSCFFTSRVVVRSKEEETGRSALQIAMASSVRRGPPLRVGDIKRQKGSKKEAGVQNIRNVRTFISC